MGELSANFSSPT